MVQFVDTTETIIYVQQQYEQQDCSTISSSSPVVPAKNLLWYSHQDYIQFREEAAKDDVSNEKLLSQASCHRKEFVQHILHQQSEQRIMGISDPKGLQVISRACSKVSKLRARHNALEVAREVGSLKIVGKDQEEGEDAPVVVATDSYITRSSPELWSRRKLLLSKRPIVVVATTA